MLPFAWFSLWVSSFVSRAREWKKRALAHHLSRGFCFVCEPRLVLHVSVYSFTLKGMKKLGILFLRSIVFIVGLFGFFFSTAPFRSFFFCLLQNFLRLNSFSRRKKKLTMPKSFKLWKRIGFQKALQCLFSTWLHIFMAALSLSFSPPELQLQNAKFHFMNKSWWWCFSRVCFHRIMWKSF